MLCTGRRGTTRATTVDDNRHVRRRRHKRGRDKSYTEAYRPRRHLAKDEDALRDYQGQLERVFNEVRDLEKHGVQPSGIG